MDILLVIGRIIYGGHFSYNGANHSNKTKG